MSIRLRLALTYAMGIATTLTVVVLIVWSLMGAALRDSLDTTLRTRADGVLMSLENEGQTGLQESGDDATAVFVAMFSPTGSLIDSSASAPRSIHPSGGTQAIDGRVYQLVTVRAPDGTVVLTGADVGPIVETQSALARILIGVSVLAGFASFFAAWLLAGRGLRPIARLLDDASSIGPGDLDRRLEAPRRMDEIGRLTLTLNAMLDRISDAVAHQRLFVAMASHELRSPLAALRAELDEVDRDGATASEYRAAVQEAQVDAIRLTDLATSLLELATAPEDVRAIARTSVDLRELTSTVSRGLAPLARQSGVAIEVEAPDQFVWVDRTRIEQALSNLIGNAIVHGKGGSTVEVRCHIDGSRPAEVLAVDVLDRGPGIGTESAEELFEPFRRGAAPLGPGSGLGLATVAATIKAHRGRFGAENRAGGGARFWFVVPVDRPRSIGLQTRDDEPP